MIVVVLGGGGMRRDGLQIRPRATLPYLNCPAESVRLSNEFKIRYFIGVKARNEMRQGDVGLNESYNLVLISDAMNAKLKSEGKTTDQITALSLAEMTALAATHKAMPSWIAVPIRARAGTYSAYFGLLSRLGNRRSVPMKPNACKTYECLARDVADSRVTADLVNA